MNNEINEIGNKIVGIAAKTALSAIPIGGTLITCIWDSVKSNSAQKRLNEWKNMLEERLSKVELTLNEIGNNEVFTSCIMKATDVALKTMQSEKRIYLADAVLNSITSNIDESIVMMYLDMLDRYTIFHIKLLHFFRNPIAFKGIDASKYYMGSPIQPLCDTFNEMQGRNEIINKIVKDLYNDGLMNTENLNGTMTGNGMVACRTTKLGSDFIDFIVK